MMDKLTDISALLFTGGQYRPDALGPSSHSSIHLYDSS
jgi:hypothetical protein